MALKMTQQEYEQWVKQNPGANFTVNGLAPGQRAVKQDKGFIGNLIGGIVDPFVGLSKQGLEGINAISEGKFGSKDYQNKFLSNQEYKDLQENPFMAVGKNVAGVASTAIPGGVFGKGALGLARAGLASGALSSIANQDGNNIDLGKVGTDALTGGAFGGGLGLAGKALGGLASKGIGGKLGSKLNEAGTAIKGSNLGFKAGSFADDTVQKVVGQLDEMGLPVTGANAEMLANQNSKAFRDLLKNKGVKVDFGGDLTKIENGGIMEGTKTNIVPELNNVNPTGTVFTEYNPQARATAPLGKNIATLDKTTGLSPTDEITIYRGAPSNQKGINSGDFVTTNKQLAKDYAGTGQVLEMKVKASDVLDNLDEPGMEEYIFRPQTAQIPEIAQKATGGASQNVKTELADFLKTKMGLGEEVASTPALQKRINDNVTRILETGGDPNKIMDVIGGLTNSKNVGEAFLTEKNAIQEGTRQFLKDKLQGVVPEAQSYFQTNAPLRSVIGDALKASQKADNVPIPFAGGASLPIPGVGLAKQGLTNAVGGLLQNAGKGSNFISDLIGKAGSNPFLNKINPSMVTKGFAIGQGASQPTTADPLATDQPAMDTMSQQASGSQYSPQEQQQIAQAYRQLVTPVKMGGMGLSNSDAEAYMINVLGITPPSAMKSPATAKTTESQKKFLAAGQLAQEALQSLNSGKIGTGKIASVGNSLSQFFGTQSPEQTDYLSKLAGARGSAVSALSGANVPPSEYARIADMIPEITDEPQIAKQKLQSFAQAMRTYATAG